MVRDSLGGRLAEIEATAKRLGAFDVMAEVDQLRARLRDERDQILARGL